MSTGAAIINIITEISASDMSIHIRTGTTFNISSVGHTSRANNAAATAIIRIIITAVNNSAGTIAAFLRGIHCCAVSSTATTMSISIGA